MQKHPELFEKSWNYIDAYLGLVHGKDSALYLMLRQALLAMVPFAADVGRFHELRKKRGDAPTHCGRRGCQARCWSQGG